MSSKLRKLKQQAFEAGRKRDWAGAAEVYAQILEQDKNNPSLQNEYGDVCLKAGDTTKALRQFLSAAAKYRQTGLLSNAQAVYKKVLRHEPNNLNANWFLAEIRSAQGLIADGVQHTMTFLAAAEEVSGEIKEIFLKRCLELFTLYPESDQVLERVERIFRLWRMPLEMARAGCLRACLLYNAGRLDEAAAAVEQYVASAPEVVNYAEHARWLETCGKRAQPAGYADVNSIRLGDEIERQAPAEPAAEPRSPAAEPPSPAAPATESTPANAYASLDLASETPAPTPLGSADAGGDEESDDDAELEKDDDGCISIDLEPDTSFAELIEAAATASTAAAKPRAEVAAAPPPAEPAPAPARGINLLDEILAEEGDDILRSSATEQVSTIASEIGRNLGDDAAADPEQQYQQGLVYLELGLHDQAVLAFALAARDDRYRLQAREMWGIALHRDGKHEEALDVLREGLADDLATGRRALGLHYHAGRILEVLGRDDEAQAHYREVHASDAGFADVVQRLRTPVA
ncbi:MAG: tetratricopeptide repeat protein [Candidatus Krumholzibacteria bacterium]|nr:tetratricopeptide repeat protein [Candidatus Krumholzibacteria bacterium]